MRSLKFPAMFNKNSTNVWKTSEHKEATMQNCVTLLHTERGELFGDPYYGLLSLFAIGFVFGTLPIFTLLGKTPSEISAKYDI